MPTPSDDTVPPSSPSALTSAHSTCPPEADASYGWNDRETRSPSSGATDRNDEEVVMADSELEQSHATQTSMIEPSLETTEEDLSPSTVGAPSSRSTTMEPDTNGQDHYSYEMPQDLGFVLTPENSSRFSETSSIRVSPCVLGVLRGTC